MIVQVEISERSAALLGRIIRSNRHLSSNDNHLLPSWRTSSSFISLSCVKWNRHSRWPTMVSADFPELNRSSPQVLWIPPMPSGVFPVKCYYRVPDRRRRADPGKTWENFSGASKLRKITAFPKNDPHESSWNFWSASDPVGSCRTNKFSLVNSRQKSLIDQSTVKIMWRNQRGGSEDNEWTKVSQSVSCSLVWLINQSDNDCGTWTHWTRR